MSSTPRLTPRLTPRQGKGLLTPPVNANARRTPLREIFNQARGPGSGEAKEPTTLQATSSTSTGGNARPSCPSRPSLAEEIREAEERNRKEEVLATPTWRDKDPETPSTWRSKLEAEIHSLRTEVETKHDDVVKLQSDCAALGRALGSIAPTVGLTPRTRKCLHRAQCLGEQVGGPSPASRESPTTMRCSELEREMHTL